jgi:hypothetical protein
MSDSPEYAFALCLSHDVDRVYKTHQYVYEAATELDPRELAGLFSGKNPWWTFERVLSLEADLGVRSSFNVLDEQHITERPVSEWFTMRGWQLFSGRYDVTDEQVASTLQLLDDFGWEVALHGSYTSSENPERFEREKRRIEAAADTEIVGNRQHYWRLSRPDTWRHLRDAGVKYDTSLGDTTDLAFQYGHDLLRPFDDEFVVFPWSLMDSAVMDSADTTAQRWENCRAVLEEARDRRTVLVADWHTGSVFSDEDKPGWADMYERMIREALEMGAWVGPPGRFYEALPHPDGTVEDALANLADAGEPDSEFPFDA